MKVFSVEDNNADDVDPNEPKIANIQKKAKQSNEFKGCPFYAGIMAKDVPGEIARLSARKLSASMSGQNPNENQDAINAAMKAFVTPTPGKPSDNDDASQGIEVNDVDSKDASN